MGVVGLVDLVNDAAGDPIIYRELDASARALLLADDPDPLLRLYAQRLASDEAYFDTPAAAYSGELYFAVSCLDYPQLFDMSDPGRGPTGAAEHGRRTIRPPAPSLLSPRPNGSTRTSTPRPTRPVPRWPSPAPGRPSHHRSAPRAGVDAHPRPRR